MAPDIYNTVAPTRPAQTRSRAVARPLASAPLSVKLWHRTLRAEGTV